MSKPPRKSAAGIAFAVLLAGIILAGCSSEVSPSSSSSSEQQMPSSSGQQPSSSTGQQPSGQQPRGVNDQNMKDMLAKAAAILGISVDKLTSAFEQAQSSLKPASGQQPPQQDGQKPPEGAKPTGGPNMQAMYEKMAEILSISADKIADAFEQAQKALQK